MTVGHFETAEQLAWQRAWRCTLTVPYVHKPPMQSRQSILGLRLRTKDHAVRNFGVFFMGAHACQPQGLRPHSFAVPYRAATQLLLRRSFWPTHRHTPHNVYDGLPSALTLCRQIGPDPGYATRRRMATLLGNLTDLPMTFVSTSKPRAPGFETECDLHTCLESACCVGCSWDPKSMERLYVHQLQWSEFLLIVRGDTPSSARLYDALAYGVRPPALQSACTPRSQLA